MKIVVRRFYDKGEVRDEETYLAIITPTLWVKGITMSREGNVAITRSLQIFVHLMEIWKYKIHKYVRVWKTYLIGGTNVYVGFSELVVFIKL